MRPTWFDGPADKATCKILVIALLVLFWWYLTAYDGEQFTGWLFGPWLWPGFARILPVLVIAVVFAGRDLSRMKISQPLFRLK